MVRYRIQVRGIVCRAWAFVLLSIGKPRALHYPDFVQNTSSGVTIEIEGVASACAAFLAALREEAPPLSRIQASTKPKYVLWVDKAFIFLPAKAAKKPR
jgi:hydrogenase maturation factor HypF (carbamoyltransferase family)